MYFANNIRIHAQAANGPISKWNIRFAQYEEHNTQVWLTLQIYLNVLPHSFQCEYYIRGIWRIATTQNAKKRFGLMEDIILQVMRTVIQYEYFLKFSIHTVHYSSLIVPLECVETKCKHTHDIHTIHTKTLSYSKFWIYFFSCSRWKIIAFSHIIITLY